MGRLYKYMTPGGEFDENAARTGQAMERAKRGLTDFTKPETFNRYMSLPAKSAAATAENEGTERAFAAKYDSKIGRGRKNRGGGGSAGSVFKP